MASSQERQWPVPMYKDGFHPLYAGDNKKIDALTADGWTDNPRNVPEQLWPRALYHKDGTVEKAGVYDRSGKIDVEASETQMLDMIESGLSVTPIATDQSFKEVPGRRNSADAIQVVTVKQDNSAEVAALSAQVAILTQMLMAKDAKPERRKPGRKPRTIVQPEMVEG